MGATDSGQSPKVCASRPTTLSLASNNFNLLKRIGGMLERAVAKWQTLSRAERLLPDDPQKQVADIKRPERFYPGDGLVLYVTSRDMPRDGQPAPPATANWR